MLTWLRGLRLLRHPELIRDWNQRLVRLRTIDKLRSLQPSAKISSDIELLNFDSDRLVLGPRVSISAGTILSLGDPHNGLGAVKIGQDTWIGQYNNIRAGGGNIEIGADCLISQFCTLVASNHGINRSHVIREQSPDASCRGVTLHDDVWLGAGVTVLPGVVIGRGAVIGAGSVVTHDVPPYEIWAGSPASRIGERTPSAM